MKIDQDFAMAVAAAALGVIVGGALLYAGRNFGPLNYAHQGFDYTG